MLAIGRQLLKRPITRCRDECGEGGGGHRRFVDPETVDLDAAQRPFLGIEAVGSHSKAAAFDEAHAVERRGGGGGARCGFHGRGIISFGGGSALRCRSEEHTSELQSLMRISYDVLCLKQKKNRTNQLN